MTIERNRLPDMSEQFFSGLQKMLNEESERSGLTSRRPKESFLTEKISYFLETHLRKLGCKILSALKSLHYALHEVKKDL